MNTLLHLLTGTERGGCEINALNLVKASPQLRHCLLNLGTGGPMNPEFERAGVEIRDAAVLGSGRRPVIRAVEAAVLAWAPAGIVAWHGMVALPEILHALRDYPGKVLVHGGNPAHSLPRLVDWRYYLREKFLGRRGEATYICCSQHVADSFAGSRYLRRFPTCVVRNGVGAPTVVQPRPKPLTVESAVTIGMTARLDRIKDHPNLLRAFAILLKEQPLATLELLGDGEMRSELDTLALTLGIWERVKFRGMVNDVYAEMAYWDIFAYSTTDREGLGNALIEAMRLGLPCVATDAGPMREIVGDPPCALLVPPADPPSLAKAMLELLTDLPRRQSLAMAGRERAKENFSLQVFSSGYLNALAFRP